MVGRRSHVRLTGYVFLQMAFMCVTRRDRWRLSLACFLFNPWIQPQTKVSMFFFTIRVSNKYSYNCGSRIYLLTMRRNNTLAIRKCFYCVRDKFDCPLLVNNFVRNKSKYPSKMFFVASSLRSCFKCGFVCNINGIFPHKFESLSAFDAHKN